MECLAHLLLHAIATAGSLKVSKHTATCQQQHHTYDWTPKLAHATSLVQT